MAEPLSDLPCLSCGYNLHGLMSTARCPECNTPISWSIEAAAGLRPLPAGVLRRLGIAARLLLLAYLCFPALPMLSFICSSAGAALTPMMLTACLTAAAVLNAVGMYFIPLDRDRPVLAAAQLGIPLLPVAAPLLFPGWAPLPASLLILFAFAPCPLLTFPRFRRAAVAIAHIHLADSCAEVGPGLTAPLLAGTLPSLPVVLGLLPPAEVAILLVVADAVLLMFAMTFFLLFYLYALYALATAARQFRRAARRRAGMADAPNA